MKRYAVACIFVLLIHFSVQVPKYENCVKQVLSGDAAKQCVLVSCYNENSYRIQGCDSVACRKGKPARLRSGNPHEEFPECCSHPVCS